MEEIVSKYSGTLLQQGYPQGPIFIFSRFFPFKVQSQELVLGTIDYDHGQSWSLSGGTSWDTYCLDDTKAFPADGIVTLQINIPGGKSYIASLLKKDENDNIIPISELRISTTSDPIHIHVNKGDQLKIVKNWRLWYGQVFLYGNPQLGTEWVYTTKFNRSTNIWRFFPCME